jgi:hypothetical protein
MPRRSDARLAATWLASCELRGFRAEDAIVVFSGYGATHDSARRYFKLTRVYDCFIVQKTGDVSMEVRRKTKAWDKFFTATEVEFFIELARLVGNASPAVIPFE